MEVIGGDKRSSLLQLTAVNDLECVPHDSPPTLTFLTKKNLRKFRIVRATYFLNCNVIFPGMRITTTTEKTKYFQETSWDNLKIVAWAGVPYGDDNLNFARKFFLSSAPITTWKRFRTKNSRSFVIITTNLRDWCFFCCCLLNFTVQPL